ncbi:efflux transporter outer membrane subunit [Chloracidobacterium sp. MS 40/45]|uniref:efflux transporter outer membrane subunit n=1 Tax=Chloracidobacterium aggregatum TaxID=2851959 RepID=UPI001B8CE71E|nr:efflux transporter outer membrane subunit [Chloracidobacterium aggregatum]QUW01507.1 efflux transporter outer membrane subunit [Chloracidobacterium sp. MS 40/45]
MTGDVPKDWLRAGATLCLAIVVAGCAARPPIRKVVVETPSAWTSPMGEGVSPQSAKLDTWWTHFHDAQLTHLVERALNANLDIRIALARVREARGQAGVEASTQRPNLSAAASTQRLRGGLPQGIGRVTNLPGISSETGIFQLGFDASWELDFFGGARLMALATREDARAAEEAMHGVQLMTAAEVARLYIELCGAQQKLALVRQQLQIQGEILELTRTRFQAGLTSQLDATRAAAQWEGLRAAVPPLEATIRDSMYRLSVLVGTPPGTLTDTPSLPTSPPEIPVGLPSDLLQRRPDIRQAEAELAAALARLGAARTDRFPKFALTAGVGRQATSVAGLTLGAGNFFAAGPTVRLPILTGGRIRNQIAVRDAQTEQAALRYEQTVLRAFEEVERALVGYLREGERRRALAAATEEQRESARLAEVRYASGLEDFTTVLEARRGQLSSALDQIESETQQLRQAVALYKALGGGW